MPDWSDQDSLYMEALRNYYNRAAQAGQPYPPSESMAAQMIEEGRGAGDYLAAREYDNRTAGMTDEKKLEDEFMNYMINHNEYPPDMPGKVRPNRNPMWEQMIQDIWGRRAEI